ncbi:hypothetical protein [Sphingobacterium deserti]|uniref:Lipoprotein n=1 Tax=Sphingobacterium deserti TaxID=1229276 RepID=A0A0B8T814_9SPHI|nr:hypothetical protein [Sphingobacterium deserti]KGE14729.1 hypothetical protein DI53_1758 [Sphingobacterium deserti]
MRKIILAFCCVATLLAACNSSNKKSEETKDSVSTTMRPSDEAQAMTEVITRFTRAYLSQDSEKANALIHPDLGLYIIYRPGAMDNYQQVERLDFKKPVPEHFPYTSFENDYVLSFAELPHYDCGGEKWDKLGFFCDSTKQANQLAQITAFKQEFEQIDATTVNTIKELEKDSYRVILTNAENLIFHIKKYKGSWYVTVLDRAYGWCDA